VTTTTIGFGDYVPTFGANQVRLVPGILLRIKV